MKKAIPLHFRTARALVLVLTLCLVVEFAKADFTFGEPTVEREQLRVLFIGNSLTNQIRTTLDSLIQASPYSDSTFEYVAPNGWNLQQHTYSENTMSKIRGSDWDFVVLQEYDNRPTLPDSCGQFYDAVAKLSEAIKESGAQVILYMIWGRRDGDPLNRQINPDYETMQQNLIEAYTEAARQVDAIIAPVGIAWQSVRRNNPDLGRQLYQNDGLHPSYKGAFLAACVLYATLFDADPTELAFNGSLSAEEASYLRRKAKEAFIPIVDFNGDGKVDIEDLIILIEHWGQDESSVDVVMDGIVDALDLEVLMSFWQQEIFPPELIAYWKLDEEEGDIVYNSISDNYGIINGDPIWRPEGGQIAGTLEFDGINDYVETGFVLDPAKGTFSVFAWIQGGAPGQVIISQKDDTFSGSGETWLGIDTLDGKLMTKLVPPPIGRFKPMPLKSEFVITDNQWHHIGFVWDGSYRILYADDIEVAKDTGTLTQPLMSSNGGLYIGADKTLGGGTFFSGLIDDVRIYNRVVKP